MATLSYEEIMTDAEVHGALSRVNNAKHQMLVLCSTPDPGPFDSETERRILHWALEYKRACNAHSHAVANVVRSNR